MTGRLAVDGGAVIDRMFAALTLGDLDAARACFVPEGRVWHGFDGLALDLEQVTEGWRGLVAGFPERSFVDVRRQPTPQGFVQQHLMVARDSSGTCRAWPVCIVVRIENGLIARLDEYIDRAGFFSPSGQGEVVTPGLE